MRTHALALALLCLVGCDRSSPGGSAATLAASSESGPLVVYTVSYPLAYFVARMRSGILRMLQCQASEYWSDELEKYR